MCVRVLPQLGYCCNTRDSSELSIEQDPQWSVLAACRPAGEDLSCSASFFRSCLQAGSEWPGSEILGCVPDSGGERAVGILHFPALSAPLMCHCLSQSFDSFSRCLLVSAFLFSSSFASVHPISLFSVSFHRKLHSYTSPLVVFSSFFLVSHHSVPIFSPSPSCFCCGGSLTPQFFCHPLMSFLALYGSCMKHLPWPFSVALYSPALL